MSYAALGLELGGQVSGQYTGYDQMGDAVTKEIVKRGGSTDSGSMKAYGTAAGAAGGAALCTAYGGGAVAPLCAKIGGAIVGLIAGHIGTAATMGAAWTLADDWNALRPTIQEAQRGVMAVRSYLTMRDHLITQAASVAGTDRGWADAWLIQRGVVGAPIRPAWRPRDEYWQAFKAFMIWAENPKGYPPHYGRTDLPTMSYCSSTGLGPGKNVPWGYKSPTANAVAKQIGISCSELLALIFYPGGPMSAPGDPINWGMVGAWQIVKSYMAIPALPPKKEIYVVSPQISKSHLDQLNHPLPKGSPPKWRITASDNPAALATTLLFKLQEAKSALLNEAQSKAKGKAAAKAAATARGAAVHATTTKLKAQYSEAERRATMTKYGAIALVVGAGAVATYMVVKRRG